MAVAARWRDGIEARLAFGLLKVGPAKVLVGLMVGRAVLFEIAAVLFSRAVAETAAVVGQIAVPLGRTEAVAAKVERV